MARLTKWFIISALLILGTIYFAGMVYDRQYYFPKHADISRLGCAAAILDKGLRESSKPDPGFYVSNVAHQMEHNAELFKRVHRKFVQSQVIHEPGQHLCEELVPALTLVHKLCAQQLLAGTPSSQRSAACKG